MGMMKTFLMDVMEQMGKDEIDDEVCERANDIMAHRIDEAYDASRENTIERK